MTERELSRGAARRLAIIQHVEEVTGNVAMTCRYFGISRCRVASSGATGDSPRLEKLAYHVLARHDALSCAMTCQVKCYCLRVPLKQN